jgi:putative endonuclease
MPILEQTRLRLMERLLNTGNERSSEGIPAHLVTGQQGERTAFFYLRRQGYIVVARQWRSGKVPGDLDLVAWDGDTVCFVEVKTRTTRDVATAEAAVDEHKRRTLRRLARYYIRQLPDQEQPTRFDILSIYFEKEKDAEFDLFKGAFGWIE